jgi:hypothetical protein
MCSALTTHTQLSSVFMHLPSVQSFYLNGLFPAVTHQILKLLCIFIHYLYIHIVSHYINGVVRCFSHLFSNWRLLFKLSIVYSIFMRFKYCITTRMELLEKFGYFLSSVEFVHYFLGSTFCILYIWCLEENVVPVLSNLSCVFELLVCDSAFVQFKCINFAGFDNLLYIDSFRLCVATFCFTLHQHH